MYVTVVGDPDSSGAKVSSGRADKEKGNGVIGRGTWALRRASSQTRGGGRERGTLDDGDVFVMVGDDG